MSIEELRGDELAGLRILVVDDEPETLELVAQTLREAGAEVVEASGAERALELLASRELHVVLSDLQMPGLDGYGMMQRLRERGLRRPGAAPIVAVALSASASTAEAKRALDAGFSVHVAKPIAMADLVDTIRAVAPPPSSRRE